MKTTAIAFVALSCSQGSGLPTRTIEVDGTAITVEVAADDASRARGLMFRDSMGADRGMLFIYPDTAPRSFWMKNTRIPLSIAYADDGGVIKHIADMTPLSEKRTPSQHPVKYALEMNKGWFDNHDVQPGDQITGIPTDIQVK